MERLKKQLIDLLEENARYTNAQLSAMTGVSEEDVARALKQLEADGE